MTLTNSGQFQITIAFNKEYVYVDQQENYIQVDRAYFVYEDDYELVLNDAAKILQQLQKNGEFDENKLSCLRKVYVPSTYIELKPEEKGAAMIERNGKHYLLLNEHTRIREIPPKLDLYENENKDV
ncbi:hypothetical protein J7E81_08555 [Bacillus sp. ISL-18]|uniref:hypothetical protein n=1 Tax=Bacillus sp. ISL-18 TaxID=2819118 RepID=UPI001BECC49E|nr:hypothetical protein [Bacillus sp. ISL-18]MBT2655293.1 hypothetical protein [Bacillus sp. ISL-18]